MPIITKPAIEKGAPASVTLDKAALAALPIVSADGYFSNSANWARVRVVYTAAGKQKEVLNFDATQVTPQAQFSVSERARDQFQVQKIIIIDFDNGSFEVPRSSLVTSEFDVNFTPPAPVLLATCALGSPGSQDSLFTLNNAFGPTLGQSFTLAQSASVTSIRTYVNYSPSLAGSLSLRLLAGEVLSGTTLGTSQPVSVSGITPGPGFIEFTFSTPVSLASGLNTFIFDISQIVSDSGTLGLIGIVGAPNSPYAGGKGAPSGGFNDFADFIFEVYGN